jgi:hypothetical protein
MYFVVNLFDLHIIFRCKARPVSSKQLEAWWSSPGTFVSLEQLEDWRFSPGIFVLNDLASMLDKAGVGVQVSNQLIN